MYLNTWADVLNQSFQTLFTGLVQYLPNIVIAIIIFIVGWLVGVGLGRVVKQVIDAIRVDHALRSTGIERVLARAGYKLSSGAFLGALVEWFFIIVFLVASLDVLGLKTVNDFMTQVVLWYLPKVIVAVLVLFVAALVSEAAEKVVVGSARAASLSSAGFVGKVTRYSIWIFAFLVALDQLNVATSFVQTLFMGFVIAISLAVGLAFGLGGQATAAKYLERFQSETKG
jgi:small-conductance mechanosensitive channel